MKKFFRDFFIVAGFFSFLMLTGVVGGIDCESLDLKTGTVYAFISIISMIVCTVMGYALED